jgi:hypothetical protein
VKAQKRIVVDLDPAEHRKVRDIARGAGVSISNLIRQYLNIPLRKHGVKTK